MKVYVDTSAWFAAANVRDRHNARAKELLSQYADRLTSSLALSEAWSLINNKIHSAAAENFWRSIRRGGAQLEIVTLTDLDRAWVIGTEFADQKFSLVDRTSFAVMERLGVNRAISFDDDFAIFRYGANRELAFEVLR